MPVAVYIVWYQEKGDRGSTVVKVLCYKSEGHWLNGRTGWRTRNPTVHIQSHRIKLGSGASDGQITDGTRAIGCPGD